MNGDDGDFTVRLDGKKIIMLDDYEEDDEYTTETTYELKGDNLKIKSTEKGNNWEDNYEATFKKM